MMTKSKNSIASSRGNRADPFKQVRIAWLRRWFSSFGDRDHRRKETDGFVEYGLFLGRRTTVAHNSQVIKHPVFELRVLDEGSSHKRAK
jgi:hypothetical protein